MVFKLYFYKSRVSGTSNFNTFLHQLVKVKNLEKDAVFNNKQKHDMFLKKGLSEKICRHNKKSFVIYNMNTNSLIETGKVGGDWYCVFVFVFCF